MSQSSWTNLVYRTLSSIHIIVVKSVQIAPQLNQLLTVAPWRNDKVRVRVHHEPNQITENWLRCAVVVSTLRLATQSRRLTRMLFTTTRRAREYALLENSLHRSISLIDKQSTNHSEKHGTHGLQSQLSPRP